MRTRRTWECNKAAFLKTWPGGYDENFEVYTPAAGLTEAEIVDTCLTPFYNPEGAALEIGCGKGFWVRKYLLSNFKYVYGVDVIPFQWVNPGPDGYRFNYVEAGEHDYRLESVSTGTIDFVWCFGVFCHLGLPSVRKYLKSVHRVLRHGAYASLYFSNKDKRPPGLWTGEPNPDEVVGWTENDWPTTERMLRHAGFSEIQEVLKHGKDTMAIVRKT